MKTFYIIIFFILGTVMGSFYCCLANRLAKNKSIIKPKSHCENCNHELKVLDLIPILSYLFLGGRCRYCKQKLSLEYLLSELFCGVLFAVSFYSFSFSYDLLLALALSSLFIIVMITDLNYYIIPDSINIAFGIIIFIINLLKYQFEAFYYLGYGLAMFVFMYLLMLIGNKMFKGESLGGGDIKLLFVLGMTMPLVLSFVGITIACFISLPLSLYLFVKKNDKILPFGPFLVAAFLIMFMFKIDVNDIYKLLLSL